MIQKSTFMKEITQKTDWDQTVESFAEKDVYFTYDYMQPFKNNGDGEPILFYLESHLGKVMYSFLYRDIAASSNFKEKLPMNTFFDISTVYGYGGPLIEMNPDYSSADSKEQFKKEFQLYFSDYCHQKGIISQFDRFHPLLDTHEAFLGYSEVTLNKKTVCMELKNEEWMTQNLTSGCRNKIRQAQKNNIKVIVNDSIETLETFKELYAQTMKKNEASAYYFFNHHFFEEVKQYSSDHILLANAYLEDKIVASALILYYDGYLHHHFSGSLPEYRNLKINNLLFYEIAKWGCENNYQYFHLGGGHESEHDSLFRFKKSFSKSEPKDFYIGKKIHDPEIYDELVALLNYEPPALNDYFPAYRS